MVARPDARDLPNNFDRMVGHDRALSSDVAGYAGPNDHRQPASAAEYVIPDGDFVRDIIKLGGKSLKKCFQCGTCSAACNLSPAPHLRAFPRRQMADAQWGLKERLIGDPSIWLCHQCNDCSECCPRGGNPGDVVAALRAYSIMHFAYPRFLAIAFASPRFLPLLFAIPSLAIVAFLAIAGRLAIPAGTIAFGKLIPDLYVAVAGFIVLGFALITAGIGLLRFWQTISHGPFAVVPSVSNGPGALAVAVAPARSIYDSFTASMIEILQHRNFSRCGADRARYLAHLAIFYGIPFLLFGMALAAWHRLTGREVPLPLGDPAMIAANVGALMVFGGINLIAYNRLKRRGAAWGRATYFDWLLIGMIYAATLSGFVLEVAHYTGLASLAYPTYLVHLVIVFTFFVYAPYGKLAHVIYRTLAVTYAKHRRYASPYHFYFLLAAASVVGIGAVAVVIGLVVGVSAWTEVDEAVRMALQGVSLSAIPATMATYSHVYLPIANVSVSLPLLVALGVGVGCLSGLFGVGGGFLMTPLLMMAGIPPAAAAASDSCQISGAASSGAYAHSRLGNVDVKLGLTILLGGILGGTGGVQVVAMLRAMGNFDFWVKITYVLVLGIVGTLMVRESATTLVKNWVYGIRQQTIIGLIQEGYVELKPKLVAPQEAVYRPFRSIMDRLPFQTSFVKAEMRTSYLFPFGLGALVGFLAAIMGVGGGFIMVPAMIYIIGVQTKIAVGTDLFQMVFTSVNVTLQQAITNKTVDLTLSLVLLIGSAVGAQIGARLSRRLKGHQLRILLGIIVIVVMIKLLLDITLPPDTYITLATSGGGGH